MKSKHLTSVVMGKEVALRRSELTPGSLQGVAERLLGREKCPKMYCRMYCESNYTFDSGRAAEEEMGLNTRR